MGRFHRHDDGTTHQHTNEQVNELGSDHDHLGADGHSHAVGPAPLPPKDRDVLDHSGYRTGGERIDVLERIFDENDRTAAANRKDFAVHGVCTINLMSSPGAGKTTLLRETLLRISGTARIGIIEGDIETSLDADRLAGMGAEIILINTGNGFGGECHLDAPMVRSAVQRLSLDDLDVILIENVGNLVCPAEFDVGEHARAMIYSITEGEEKPLKYPVMFRSVDLVVINKMDLLPYLDVDLDLFRANLRQINPHVATIEVSARTGDGVDEWCRWITDTWTAATPPLAGHPTHH